jgi:lathosterol oxidase
MIATLRNLPLWIAVIGLFVQNLLVFSIALVAGKFISIRFAGNRVSPEAGPLTTMEIVLSAVTVILNTLVTIAGYLMWRQGYVSFRQDYGIWAALDIIILLVVMDAAMYLLHRIAHLRIFFPLLHSTHHRYVNVRPLTLFVLNPAETLSFGLLWLAVISLFTFSWAGMSVYLFLNVAFGTLGHLGVEPIPERLRAMPLMSYVSTGTFHAGHHQDREHNFGFYTSVWDRVFGTLGELPVVESDR